LRSASAGQGLTPGAKTPSPALDYHQRSRATRLATLLDTGPQAPGADDISQSDIPGGRLLTVTARRGGRLIAGRSRRVAARAAAIAIHGIRAGARACHGRLGSARAVVRWARIRDPKP